MAKRKTNEEKKIEKKIEKNIEKGIEGCCTSRSIKGGCGGFAYFLGFLGATIYYIQSATGFWDGIVGILKAMIWPAFLVFELLKLVNAG